MKHTPSQSPLLPINSTIQMVHPTKKKDETSSSPPPLPPGTLEFSDGEVAIRELVKSQELLRKLREILVETPAEIMGTVIVDEVLRSIVTAITAVQEVGVKMEDLCLVEFMEEEKSTVMNNCRSVDLLKGKKRGETQRKRSNGISSTKVESKKLEDGYSWRKYGQKEIQYAKFPRSYYRCSHRFDLGCKARKQVQQNESDPSIYYITYLDHHICKDIQSKKPYHHQAFESSKSTSMAESSKQEEDQDAQLAKDDEDDGFYSELLMPLPAPVATTTITMSELGDVTSSFDASMGFQMEFMDEIFSHFQGELI